MAAEVEVTESIIRFVALDLLGDPDSIEELTPDAPLLEWGILDSLNTARLLAFVSERLDVHIPMESVVVENFRDVASIARLVGTLQDAQSSNGDGRLAVRETEGG